ncbi:MAG TPA: bifunctional lysylphosphatidylglycerol synthetase/lysine--tRNA ligase LysX [Micromonosporaceae bacterium]
MPAILTFLFGAAAWLCALLALVPLLRNRTEPVQVAAEYLAIPIRPNLAYAAFLGLIAASLRRRTRASWWIVVLLYFGPAAVGSLIAGLTEPPVLISAAILLSLLGLTLAAHGQFRAHVERGNGWRALATLVLGLTLASGLAWLLVWAFPGSLEAAADQATWAVNHVLGGLGSAAALAIPGRPPPIVTFLCGLFGAVAFLAAVWVLFRPTRRHGYLTGGQEHDLRTLLAGAGERDSLGYFATRRDKTAIFSDSGKAAVTYRVVFGTSLASGDPIGDPEAWPPAIAAWLAEARQFAWTPAVLGASEEGALAYQRAGLDALQLGDEAIVETSEFSLDGRAMRPVRQAVNRLAKAGYRTRIRRHRELDPAELARVAARADTWRDTEDERGFSMALGRLGDPADGDCMLVEAIDAAGDLRALLSFVPWGSRGLSLDLMRRDRAADNGLVELMVTDLLAAGGRLAVERISLNFAMFREVFEEGGRIGAGPFIRLSRSLLLVLSHWWQLESLYRSNAKYRPTWEPRLVCFRNTRDLPRISVAMGIAEGFLSVPKVDALFRRGRARAIAPMPARPVTEQPAVPARPVTEQPAVPAPPSPVEAPAAPARTAQPAPYPDLPEPVRARWLRLDQAREAGVDPYPAGVARTGSIAMIRNRHPALPPDTRTGDQVAVAGRVIVSRGSGRFRFATVQDGTGRIQLMLSEETAGAEAYARWASDVDPGDLVSATGELVTSRRGEVSVAVTAWTFAAKCLRPWPEGHPAKLADPAALALVHERGRVVALVRRFLADQDFIEVASPGAAGGPVAALARVMAGEERVFQLDQEAAHPAEPGGGVQLTGYQAWADEQGMLELVQDLVAYLARSGPTTVPGSGPLGRETFTLRHDVPIDGAPMVRARGDDARLARRWELVSDGATIGSGWSVLTDPVAQAGRQPGGDVLTVLEYAVPPTGGFQVHLDRLMPLLTGRTRAVAASA